jgi:ribulose-phosphate 3-epimerase
MGTGQRIIAPSLLACDFGRLAEEVQKVQDAGADWLHVDVMDGHFVPNLTIGPVVVEAIRRASRIPLDVHLMINHPEQYLTQFIEAGAHYLTVHVEAPGLRTESGLVKALRTVRQAGARAGLSLRPRTSAEALKAFLGELDLILVMSVEPGFGGQAFMPEVIPKVRQLRQWFGGAIAVDGGINAETGRQMCEAGANVLVAGTYVVRSGSYRDAIQSRRGG